MVKKKIKITYNAPVLLTLVLLSLVDTVMGVITHNWTTYWLFSIKRESITNPLLYIRVFTHILGHSNFEHFIGNATTLILVGPMLEEKYGFRSMIKVIISTAVLTGILHCILWSDISLCGASGIVFACIVMASFTTFNDGEIPLSFILVAIMFVGKEIYVGISVVDSISNVTHILGGIVGGWFGYRLNKK